MRKHIFRRPFLPGNGVSAFRGAKERIQQPYGVVYPWVGNVILPLPVVGLAGHQPGLAQQCQLAGHRRLRQSGRFGQLGYVVRPLVQFA